MKPILFNAEMVRAILDGRKTQTRRIVKPQPESHHWENVVGYEKKVKLLECQDGLNAKFIDTLKGVSDTPLWVKCPFGSHGDRLWVQEGHRIDEVFSGLSAQGIYLADNQPFEMVLSADEYEKYSKRKFPNRPTPGRFMYRSLFRINLEIVNVRVERVQDISEKDAMVEGALALTTYYDNSGTEMPDYKAGFQILWDSINKASGFGWDVNPWVWVVEFRRIES